MEGSRAFLMDLAEKERSVSFERIFDQCQDRIHAIFLFLSILELIQQRFLNILSGEGRNNFIIEYTGLQPEAVEAGGEES